jgi:hypothetical protein
MLASSFLSADQLGLSTKQHGALIGVLGMLERGELRHVTAYGDDDVAGFNMGTFACGSVHCIGGWADRLYGTDFHTLSLLWGANQDCRFLLLYELLYGDLDAQVELEDVSVAEAAEALRNYLTTGSARWLQVLGDAQS